MRRKSNLSSEVWSSFKSNSSIVTDELDLFHKPIIEITYNQLMLNKI